jgi:LDH2 family malate/lactate/ureidoglycolate dehydrogenase
MTTEGALTAAQIHDFATRVLTKLGTPDEDAKILADAMVWSALRGDTDHSLRRLDQIARRKKAGGLEVRADWTPVKKSKNVTVLNGNFTWGVIGGTRAMRHAIASAKESGVGIAVVRDNDNTGALGWYPSVAASEGLIGMAITNGAVLMPAWGGTAKRTIGNQAYAIASPAGKHPPVIFDSALTMTLNALRKLSASGEPVPPGLVLDAKGQPTTNADEGLAGMLLPIGGHRGFGLAIMWEILTGVLSGGMLLGEIGEMENVGDRIGNSLFLMAIDPSAFMPVDEFLARVDRVVDEMHAAEPASGVDRVRVPGERAARNAIASARDGVVFPERHVKMLRALGAELGVEWPVSA